MTVPGDDRGATFFKNTDKLTVDQLIAEKKRWAAAAASVIDAYTAARQGGDMIHT